MPVLILVLAIAFGVFLCTCVLVLVATSRRVGWREVLVYFGLADPPLPPDEDPLPRSSASQEPVSKPPAQMRS